MRTHRTQDTLTQSIREVLANPNVTTRTKKSGVWSAWLMGQMFILFILFILVMWVLIWSLENILMYKETLSNRQHKFDVSPSLQDIPSIHNQDMKKIHDTCTGLSNKSCQHAGFCTLLNGTQCVGGNKHGPTYYTNNGNKVDVDYYHHNNKCYGKCN